MSDDSEVVKKKLPYDLKEKLIDAVIEEIQKDVAKGDYTAIGELLESCPEDNLKFYLPEDQWSQFEISNSEHFIRSDDD